MASLLDRLGREIATDVGAAPVMRVREVRAPEALLSDEEALMHPNRITVVVSRLRVHDRTTRADYNRAKSDALWL